MIKDFKKWNIVNEVDELTEMKPKSKYMAKIIEAYRNMPDVRPSRNPNKYVNAKKILKGWTKRKSDSPDFVKSTIASSYKQLYGIEAKAEDIIGNTNLSIKLHEFIQQKKEGTYADVLCSVIEEWYRWPDASSAKSVLIDYIKNDDDLANLTVSGVVRSDPTQAIAAAQVGKDLLKIGKKVIPSASNSLDGLFKKVSALFKKKVNESSVNEALPAVAVLAIDYIVWDIVSGAWKYIAYGDIEEIEDDALLSWISPYLNKDFVGIFGDDPISASYFSVFNTMMMVIYDAWNMCMGQSKYGSDDNPIKSWNTGKNNYIDSYYESFCESDDEVSRSFRTFMTRLNVACNNDSKNPAVFESCPWFYTSGRIIVKLISEGQNLIIRQEELSSWVKNNASKYRIVPSDNSSVFYAKLREGDFMPLRSLGIKKKVEGSPLREVVLTLDGIPVGTKGNKKLTLADLELSLIANKKKGRLKGMRVSFEDITKSPDGKTLMLVSKDFDEKKKEEKLDDMNFEEIKKRLREEKPSDFAGADDI